MRSWLSLWLVSMSFVAGACGGGDDDDTGAGDADADADADGDSDGDGDNDDPSDGDEKVFVFDTLAIGEQSDGFDLDEHQTTSADDPTGCGKVDGPEGVDNQLGPLVDAIVEGADLDADPDALLLERIQDGSLLLLTRLLDLDDGTSDPRVPLYFYIGADADADVANNLTGQGDFNVNPSSLTAGGDLEDPLIKFDEGSIRAGAFETEPALFRVLIPFGNEGQSLDLGIEQAQISFDYSEDGLTRGKIGGFVRNETLLEALNNLQLSVDIPEQLVRTVLASQADIDALEPGPTDNACTEDTVAEDCSSGQTCEGGFCVEPDGNCDALSLGLVFTAVPAHISGIAPAQ